MTKMTQNQWRRFEQATEDKELVAELSEVFARHNLNGREVAVIVSALRLRPEFSHRDFPAKTQPIAARPITGEKAKKLKDRSENALMALRVWRDCMVRDNNGGDMPKMLDSAINIFMELRREWALATGHPQEISGETLAKIVDAVTAHTKAILKDRIYRGEF